MYSNVSVFCFCPWSSVFHTKRKISWRCILHFYMSPDMYLTGMSVQYIHTSELVVLLLSPDLYTIRHITSLESVLPRTTWITGFFWLLDRSATMISFCKWSTGIDYRGLLVHQRSLSKANEVRSGMSLALARSELVQFSLFNRSFSVGLAAVAIS